MATEKEYQALIDALSGECERLHKALNDIRAEIEQSRYGLVNDGLDLALKIIDKHTK